MKVDLGQLEFIHQSLRWLALWVEDAFEEMTVTSLYRINDPGVHGQLPLRGLDFRDLNPELSKKIEQHVNDCWVYDESRPSIKCCVYHENRGGSGKHLHLQVCDKTKKIRRI